MNKKELVDAVQELTAPCADITKKQAEAVLESLGEIVTKQLTSAGELNLPGIGKLHVKKRAPRVARNPRTGEQVQVAATKAVKFTPSSTLKKAVAA